MSLRPFGYLLAFAILLAAPLGCGRGAPLDDDPIFEPEVATTILGPADHREKLAAEMPELSPGQPVKGGRRSQVTLTMPSGSRMTVWVYQPEPLPAAKVPCVFIAPGGTMMVHGQHLSQGDQQEHLPWVEAGFAVVAYELSGHADAQSASDIDLKFAAEEFRQAGSGLTNAKLAMTFAEKKIPFVDASRFYTAGHSSAGTIALYVAQHDPRVKGTALFMPAIDIREELGIEGMTYIQDSGIVPNAGEYVARISPSTYVERVARPTFLFYVANDTTVRGDVIEVFGKKLRELGREVTVVRAPTGGHHQPMLDEGLPLAIQWAKLIEAMH